MGAKTPPDGNGDTPKNAPPVKLISIVLGTLTVIIGAVSLLTGHSQVIGTMIDGTFHLTEYFKDQLGHPVASGYARSFTFGDNLPATGEQTLLFYAEPNQKIYLTVHATEHGAPTNAIQVNVDGDPLYSDPRIQTIYANQSSLSSGLDVFVFHFPVDVRREITKYLNFEKGAGTDFGADPEFHTIVIRPIQVSGSYSIVANCVVLVSNAPLPNVTN